MEDVKKWLMGNTGYCDGYGAGDVDGTGYCDGDGYVEGTGYGHGYGSGYGSGDGFGDGAGSGFGSGTGTVSGAGYGSGDGYGYGYGEGDGTGYGYDEKTRTFQGKEVHMIDNVPTIIEHIKGSFAKGFILNSDFTLEPCFVAKGSGYFAHGKTLKEARDYLRDKIFEDMAPEEAIKEFLKTFKHGQKYAGTEFFEWHHMLTGSCLMGREAFVKNKGLDVNAKYSVDEFIALCENDYGRDIIKQLKIEYEKL